MKLLYFNGFCLENEEVLFQEYLVKNDYTISGFSYGAIKAFKFAMASSAMDIRVDLLQLFSPAFFNQKHEKYKRMQLIYFNKDKKKYCDNFLKNSGFSKEQSEKYFTMGKYKELDELLNYQWDQSKLQMLIDNGTKIEVYLGSDDKIVDSQKALEFFVNFSEVYFIKNKGHIL
ncbi:MAG: pimelyl-ACP methyl ester esterase BioV [Campylobacterota bacterium]|nr:pimelyl-ACP methyl ester esterase BioV [Campylobacterota bacterium]